MVGFMTISGYTYDELAYNKFKGHDLLHPRIHKEVREPRHIIDWRVNYDGLISTKSYSLMVYR